MKRAHQLSKFAEEYLGDDPSSTTRAVVHHLHAWLSAKHRSPRSLTEQDISDFMKRLAKKLLRRRTAMVYLGELSKYLKWLEERGLSHHLHLDEIQRRYFLPLKPRKRKPIPEELRQYLELLAPTRRPLTVVRFRYTLRNFHEWLQTQPAKVADVDRPMCLRWFQHLHDSGLHPATRGNQIACVRIYLDWLWETGAIKCSGRELIRSADFPQVPDYLPRPLSAEEDRQLQSRLSSSDSSLAIGLYLMRRTGLRIGELRDLERECVRADHHGQQFLKVPLGKLHNERLVPLDDAALQAVTKLQRRAPPTSPWLLETIRGRPIRPQLYRNELKKLAAGLPIAGRLTPHRLRHTFATSLLNGGMSLMGIMRLLGHRHYKMTLRYTRISDETLGREYFEALTHVTERYELSRPESSGDSAALSSDPGQLLRDAIQWVNKHLSVGPSAPQAKLLAHRLRTARDELQRLRQLVSVPRR
jgi:site-specific recombinase XerD